MPKKNSKTKNNRPIGIFDSGIGGLTVLKEISKKLKSENLVYFGDTARVPYGGKSQDTIKKYSLEIADFLLSKNVKMIVVACNTVSSTALNMLKKRLNIPVLGVIAAGSKEAAGRTVNGKIAVIGTEATIRSGSYQNMLARLSGRPVSVYARACPVFVPLVEEGWLSNKPAVDTAEIYLKYFRKRKADTIILGCTHYPLLKGLIRRSLEKGISIVDSARAVADETAELLKKKGMLNHAKNKGKERYYVSDDILKFKKLARRFLGRNIRNVKITKLGN